MNTPQFPAHELRLLLLQSRCLRSRPTRGLSENLEDGLNISSPLLGETALMLREHLGKPQLYWCQDGYQTTLPVEVSDCGVLAARLSNGGHLRVFGEATRIYVILRSSDCRLHVAFEFLACAQGAPNEIRVRLCHGGESFLVKVSTYCPVPEPIRLRPAIRAA